MSVTFVPSAVIPPSAKSTAWTISTTVMHSTAVHGPTRTAVSAPPMRWPLVPPPTGKFIICTAKTKAAVSPASGAVRSSSSSRALRRARATVPAARTPVVTDVGGVEESVGYVHVPPATLLAELVCN